MLQETSTEISDQSLNRYQAALFVTGATEEAIERRSSNHSIENVWRHLVFWLTVGGPRRIPKGWLMKDLAVLVDGDCRPNRVETIRKIIGSMAPYPGPPDGRAADMIERFQRAMDRHRSVDPMTMDECLEAHDEIWIGRRRSGKKCDPRH